jgi:hypothetical protein
MRELILAVEITVVLVLAALGLALIVIWLLWSTVRIRGTVERSTNEDGASRNTTRFDAELFVETYRRKQREVDRNSVGTHPSPREKGR